MYKSQELRRAMKWIPTAVFRTRRLASQGKGRNPVQQSRYRPTIQVLEDRTLLASVTLLGVPNWVEQGPGPILVPGSAAAFNQNGAVQSIAARPGDATTLFVGTVNGGVWRTTTAMAANPTWTATT